MWRYLFILPFFLSWSAPSYAGPGPTPVLAQDVGVCDPFNPKNCLQPTAGGAIPISGTIVATPPTYAPLGPDCKLTVTGASPTPTTSCSGGIPATANYALVCNEASAARWSQTAAPTTTTGQILGAGAVTNPVCTTFGPSPHAALTALQWIEQTGAGTATLNFSFYLYQ